MNGVSASLRDKCFVEGVFSLEMFTELLIKECCKVIEAHYEPTYDGYILRQYFDIAEDGDEQVA